MAIRYVDMETLKNIPLSVTNLEVVEQKWPEKSSYSGYVKNGRYSNGIIIICSDVELEFSGNHFSFPAHKGDIVMIPHRIKYHVSIANHSPSKHIDSYTINFLLHDENGNEIVPDIEPGIICQNSTAQSDISTLSTDYHSIHPNYLKISSGFFHLLYRITDEVPEKLKNYYPIRHAVNWLNSHWNQNDCIEDIAAISKMSVGHFQRLFKEWSGITPIAYRNMLRINHAKTMLANTDFSIALIASAVGFEDALYFSKVFRTETGLSPKQYRQKYTA